MTDKAKCCDVFWGKNRKIISEMLSAHKLLNNLIVLGID